ncbi:hypothetical protein PSTG_00844 [Puccinia striiformis f. sp. tritici PST-78]|uniref:HAT C-terminal dimerisation domain-containing protein n=1 Tax=Puccinia striiformis f. sp. tritici PST-78 TaxID=1165861 RepID=A0A0L0W3I5_9BASI|nr:hypothetical protein PSTG_00844 [Puccinia striiformis f. sp. tritici PST-78]
MTDYKEQKHAKVVWAHSDPAVDRATSVDVERAFSFGRHCVTQKRHRLNSISVTRGMSVAFYSKNRLIGPGLLKKWKDGLKEEKEKKRNSTIESIEVD